MSVLYQSDPVRGATWARVFAEQAPDIEFRIWPDAGKLDDVEYLVAWQPPKSLLKALPGLRVLFSTGAGVDQLDLSALPPQVDVVRMVEPGIVNGMIEYVCMSVLLLHRNLLDYMQQQTRQVWHEHAVLPAHDRHIGVMGLGVLGRAVLNRLKTFGYQLSGWSRSGGDIDGVDCYAGAEELKPFLRHCDMLVCLLPLTGETRGMLNAALFAALPRGAALINVGRGAQLVPQDLLHALDAGQLSQAILDVSDPEPLPPAHALWSHPRVLITPHVASMTQPQTAALVVIDQLRRMQRGEPLHDVVDRRRGY